MTRCLGVLTLVLGLVGGVLPGAARAWQEPRGETPAPSIRFGDPPELAYDVEFFPGTDHDPQVPSPDEILGDRPFHRLLRLRPGPDRSSFLSYRDRQSQK